jgi:hypothetical protein
LPEEVHGPIGDAVFDELIERERADKRSDKLASPHWITSPLGTIICAKLTYSFSTYKR